MLTNTGKNILAKYLINQAPAYASYIAIGCGATPIASGTSLAAKDFSAQTSLQFETFRSPIISRGYTVEDGVKKIVFTAELPTQERYEITEIGVFSAGSNPSAVGYDSRVLYEFARTEQWRFQEALLNSYDYSLRDGVTNNIDWKIPDTVVPSISFDANTIASNKVTTSSAHGFSTGDRVIYSKGAATTAVNSLTDNIEYYVYKQDDTHLGFSTTYANAIAGTLVSLTATVTAEIHKIYTSLPLAFQTNATNTVFSNLARQQRGEQCRFLNNMIMLRGDFSTLDGTSFASSSNYIKYSSNLLNIDKNSPLDKIKTAFSIVSVAGDGSAIPASIKIGFKFITSSGPTASFTHTVTHSSAPGSTTNFNINRYYVAETTLGSITKDAGFSWNQVTAVQVYAVALDTNGTTKMKDFYIGLDAVRLDNVSSNNPIYGLVAYSPVVNSSIGTDSLGAPATYAAPILKIPNTSGFVEFRVGIDI